MESNTQSADTFLISSLNHLGMARLATAARRLHCPVNRDQLVLEVGSGDTPYPRSDVLLDSSFSDYERGGKLVVDRPLVLGVGERLPFRDGAFDFSIASHVLEHSPDPAAFLGELQRVSRAGYIETPDATLEMLYPNRAHRLFVTTKEAKLIIVKKASWDPNPFLSEAWSALDKRSLPVCQFIKKHEVELLTRFHWVGQIPFTITNDEIDASWRVPHPPILKSRPTSRQIFRRLIRHCTYTYARIGRRKLSTEDLLNLLKCCDCHGHNLSVTGAQIQCQACGKSYPVQNGCPVMFPNGHSWD